ncbi:MAG TPA: branched-chain amino acid ABC transporter permease [Nitriliruptorales bacterium]
MSPRAVSALGGLLVALLTLGLGASPALGQDGTDEATAVFGTIEDTDDAPLQGVAVRVTNADGSFDETVQTDAAGQWRVEVPGVGSYTIEIDEATFPEGVGLRDPTNNPTTIGVRSGQERRILFRVGEGAAGGIDLGPLAQATYSGLLFGLIIAVTSIGLSLIFGTTGLINFAHGEFVALGAIVAWFLNVRTLRLHLVLAAVLAALIVGLVSGGLERELFARLRRRRIGGFQFLVITIGLSLLMRHALLLWYGNRRSPYAQYSVVPSFEWGPLRLNPRDLVVMALATIILVAVATMLQRTRAGKAMRAVADNPDLAESSGIDVDRVILYVWILGGILAGLGGVLQGLVATVEWSMGFRLLLLMFAGVILGGLGTAYGAMLGGVLVGVVTEVSTVWLNAELRIAWALVVLIGVLLIRPQGLLGVKERLG